MEIIKLYYLYLSQFLVYRNNNKFMSYNNMHYRIRCNLIQSTSDIIPNHSTEMQ